MDGRPGPHRMTARRGQRTRLPSLEVQEVQSRRSMIGNLLLYVSFRERVEDLGAGAKHDGGTTGETQRRSEDLTARGITPPTGLRYGLLATTWPQKPPTATLPVCNLRTREEVPRPPTSQTLGPQNRTAAPHTNTSQIGNAPTAAAAAAASPRTTTTPRTRHGNAVATTGPPLATRCTPPLAWDVRSTSSRSARECCHGQKTSLPSRLYSRTTWTCRSGWTWRRWMIARLEAAGRASWASGTAAS